MSDNQLGDAGAAAASEALKSNATLTSLDQVACALLCAGGPVSQRAYLPSSPRCSLRINMIGDADILNLVADRPRVNKLALKVPAWVALAVARLTEVSGHLREPPFFAECAVLPQPARQRRRAALPGSPHLDPAC
jgi:hypothetical protein